MSSDSEMDVSVHSTPKRVKISNKIEGPFYGTIGTPMPCVDVENEEEWEEWKKNEIEKGGKIRTQRQLFFKKDKLPKVSDSEHYMDRDVHHRMNKEAKVKVESGLGSLNEDFNCGKNDEIAIKINGKELSKKECEKFRKALRKANKKQGKPKTAAEIFGEDDEDAKFNEMWAKKREKLVKKAEKMKPYDEEAFYSPFNEFCDEMEENGEDDENMDRKHYIKWLEVKVAKADVSYKYPQYQSELIKMKKKEQMKNSKRRKFKNLVKGVQQFYRNIRSRESDEEGKGGKRK